MTVPAAGTRTVGMSGDLAPVRTVVATLLGGAAGAVAVGYAAGLAQVRVSLNLPPLYLAIDLVATALLGRWLATRGADRAR